MTSFFLRNVVCFPTRVINKLGLGPTPRRIGYFKCENKTGRHKLKEIDKI